MVEAFDPDSRMLKKKSTRLNFPKLQSEFKFNPNNLFCSDYKEQTNKQSKVGGWGV